jgi:putative nucleotidyltransferase with HDIG domain
VGFVGAGFKLGSAAIGLFVILQYAKLAPFDFAAGLLGATLALLSGPINTGLLVFLLPLFERFFMVTTIMRLQELGNINLPLIRELILKAPGTYNHSVAVGTLSERAAEAIGLNPVFARVACFYHDIGKSIHPEYFVENQRGQNIHDRIGPEESVTLVVEHVTEGIRMARAAKLPSAMVDIIPQHHGTKLLTFFHEKAKANATTPDEIDESRFRYPGPKPQSKMAAIIMLADAVEAAARTLSDHSQEKLLELIQKIVATTTEDGQLSECDITLAEIDRIAFNFLETLSSIYHARITYPGFEFGRTQESAS